MTKKNFINEIDNRAEIENAISHLNNDERMWLQMLQSVVDDNPWSRRVYGSDILKKSGIEEPFRPSHAATMQAAADAILKMTHISMTLDVTEENRAYESANELRHFVSKILTTNLVSGYVTVMEYENGTRDFTVDLSPMTPNADMTTALPRYMYAKENG